jgi:hypothetical protein
MDRAQIGWRPSTGLRNVGANPGHGRGDDVVMTSSEQPQGPSEPLVHPDDQAWISEEMAAETLKRAADGSKPLPWSQVEADLDEMDRRGV